MYQGVEITPLSKLPTIALVYLGAETWNFFMCIHHGTCLISMRSK